MNGVRAARFSHGAAVAIQWLPVIVGLLVLYVPTFYGLATKVWHDDEHAHGPIILGVIVWLVWRKRAALLAAGIPENQATDRSTAFAAPAFVAAPVPGIALLGLGLLLYVLGRSQEITLLEVGSLVPVLAGTLLALRGWRALHALWFPLLFIGFMVPLPQFLVDDLSGPLKLTVSAISEQLLYTAGYPVARTGVVLTIGQYQLLIADACSGLNSMFSLLAVGAVYLYLAGHKSRLHNGLIMAGLLPIAFCANIVRVLTLVLVTYHFGDAAGQGFVHRFSGMVLFLTALTIIFLLDAFLARAIKRGNPA